MSMKEPTRKEAEEPLAITRPQAVDLALLVVCLLVILLLLVIPAGAIEVDAVYQGF